MNEKFEMKKENNELNEVIKDEPVLSPLRLLDTSINFHDDSIFFSGDREGAAELTRSEAVLKIEELIQEQEDRIEYDQKELKKAKATLEILKTMPDKKPKGLATPFEDLEIPDVPIHWKPGNRENFGG